jgi:hypothetical protein
VHQLGSAQCSQKLMVGQINMHPPKKEKKVVSTPMNLLLLKDISSHSHVQGNMKHKMHTWPFHLSILILQFDVISEFLLEKHISL